MAQFPVMPLYTDALIADTSHLDNAEFGAYTRLLVYAWRTPDCSLPNDDKRLAIMLGVTPGKWRKMKPAVLAFWTVDGDVIRQKKQTEIRQKVAEKVSKKVLAGKASAAAKARKTKEQASTGVPTDGVTDGQQYHNHNQSKSSSNEELVIAFEGFTTIAKRAGWPVPRDFTASRKKAMRARLKQVGGLSEWASALHKCEASTFLCESGWFGLDWILKPANLTKVLEGNYDNGRNGPDRPGGGSPHNAMLAGFAEAFDVGVGRSDSGAAGSRSIGPGSEGLDGGPGGDPSEPLLRLAGSG